MRERTRSFSAYLDHLSEQGHDFDRADPGEMARVRSELEGEVTELEEQVEDAKLRSFFESRFVPVALAGRVPVKADARYGAIAIGDPLTASPTPGVAI